MIYGNKGGHIGFSSSKKNDLKKQLFTPIHLSLPNVSDIDNHHENNLNSPRKNEKKTQSQNDINLNFIQRKSNKNFTHIPKVQFNIPLKKKYSSTNTSLEKNNNELNDENSNITNDENKSEKNKDLSNSNLVILKRSKSKKLNEVYKSLLLFDENFDILVNSIKLNKDKMILINKKEKENQKAKINNILPIKAFPLPKDKEKEKVFHKIKPKKSSSTLNNPVLVLNPNFTSLEDEAKSMTNTIEIANFYEYTKNCMRIIVELRENKSKASFPNKVKILNPNNRKKLAVFDLDETLIHGVVNISNYKKEENIISITLPSKKIAKIGVNIRPHWKESIERVSNLYTIAIYTASHKSYADAVLNFLDPENKYFYNRLYRSNCIDCKLDGKDLYIKDMNIFEDFDLKDILIVDNSVMAFAYNLDNGIPILPYYDAEKDFELLFVAYYFESLYNCDDLRVINKQYMKLDYYLKQALEEIKRENEEEEDNYIENDIKKKEMNNNNNNVIKKNKEKDKDKVVSTQNLILLKKQRERKKGKKRESKFIQEFRIDLKELRNKFSIDNEIIKK